MFAMMRFAWSVHLMNQKLSSKLFQININFDFANPPQINPPIYSWVLNRTSHPQIHIHKCLFEFDSVCSVCYLSVPDTLIAHNSRICTDLGLHNFPAAYHLNWMRKVQWKVAFQLKCHSKQITGYSLWGLRPALLTIVAVIVILSVLPGGMLMYGTAELMWWRENGRGRWWRWCWRWVWSWWMEMGDWVWCEFTNSECK